VCDEAPVSNNLGGFLVGPSLDGVFNGPRRRAQQRIGCCCQARG